jgi:hypothetical protein
VQPAVFKNRIGETGQKDEKDAVEVVVLFMYLSTHILVISDR